jgi:peroxiredoxin
MGTPAPLAGTGGQWAMIKIGTFAPDLVLVSTRGVSFRLADLRGRQRALLLFYPRNLAGG